MKRDLHWVLGAVDELINRVNYLEKQLTSISKKVDSLKPGDVVCINWRNVI